MLTDKEIRKVAEDFYCACCIGIKDNGKFAIKAFLHGASFAKAHYEKELAERTQENLKLIADNANRSEEKHYLIQSYDKLIEKMKCCANCEHCGKNRLNLFCTLDEKVFTGQDLCCKWELKE